MGEGEGVGEGAAEDRRHSGASLFVVVGGTGDLMERKLLPALHQLNEQVGADGGFAVLGVARSDRHDDASYRAWACDAIHEAGIEMGERGHRWCMRDMFYQSIGDGGADDYDALALRMHAIEEELGLSGNRTFYLALPPGAVPSTITGLGECGLADGPGWTRLVIEKPFGRDLASAHELNALVHGYFDEAQIYRIDHYLGKETVQNLLVLRFANAMFESLWNRDRVESVHITVAETLGLEGRAGYYDRTGALRDMVQSHITQLMTLVAMEVPASFDADAIRTEKVKVLRSMAPIRPADVVLGQYGGGMRDGMPLGSYADEPDVARDTTTETYAALRLEIDNWRWKGVPFYVRTGKRLPRRVTQVVVQFRQAPVFLFGSEVDTRPEVHSNLLAVTLQPDEGFDLRFEVKRPGEPFQLATHGLDFFYEEAYGRLGEAYETLLADILHGDQTLFVRADEVEEAWRIYAPLLDRHEPPHVYESGSWGPTEADELVDAGAGEWLLVDRAVHEPRPRQL